MNRGRCGTIAGRRLLRPATTFATTIDVRRVPFPTVHAPWVRGDRGSFARSYTVVRLMFAMLAALVLLGACGVFPRRDAPTPEPGVNLIAYATTDGQIKTVSPDGSNQVRISPTPASLRGPSGLQTGPRLLFPAPRPEVIYRGACGCTYITLATKSRRSYTPTNRVWDRS